MAFITGIGNSANPSFEFVDASGTGFYYDNATSSISASIATATKLRITSSGIEIVGGTQSTNAVAARQFKSAEYDPSSNSGGIAVGQFNGYGGIAAFYDNSASASPSGTSAITLSTQNDGEVFKIDYSGRVTLGNGAGINFGSVASAVHTLDDYEQGNFVPGISIGGIAQTVTAQFGAYTKVGELVCLTGYLKLGPFTDTGNVTITGLPFVVKDAIGSSLDFASSPIWTNIRPTAYADENYYCILPGGGTTANLYVDSISSAQNTGQATEAAVKDTMEFRFVVTYFAD